MSATRRDSASRIACSAGVSDGVPMAPSLTTVGVVLGPLAVMATSAAAAVPVCSAGHAATIAPPCERTSLALVGRE